MFPFTLAEIRQVLFSFFHFISLISSGVRQQMVELAGGNSAMTFEYGTFSAFESALNDIVAAACESDLVDGISYRHCYDLIVLPF